MTKSPYYVDRKGELRFRCHAGQKRLMDSQKRFILVLAGTQSGKTISAAWWMLREMCRRGPGDYLVVSPTFRLLDMKCLPEYRKLFVDRLHFGTLRENPTPLFTMSKRGEKSCFGGEQTEPTRIIFGHAQDPDSLESATAKAAHLDEAGQKKFRIGSWEAVQRRLSIYQGRALLPTTPYTLGWVKNELHDKALSGHDDIDLVQFESTMNPAFPEAEFERARESLPKWKFDMMYRGIYTRPAGMIYDCFTSDHKVRRFPIPSTWRRYVGLDFGGTNTAAVFLAEHPDTLQLYLYARYHKGGRTAEEHGKHIRKGGDGSEHSDAGGQITRAVGGSMSEDQWRLEFKVGGLTVHPPDLKDVEVGIQRVYELFKRNRLFVFDDLADVIDDLESYSRVVDETGQPTEQIEDKATYHRLDALRYISTYLNKKASEYSIGSMDRLNAA